MGPAIQNGDSVASLVAGAGLATPALGEPPPEVRRDPVCTFAFVLTFVAFVLLVVQWLTSSDRMPIWLSRRLFCAHLFACLFLELGEEAIWSHFATWSIALHILYFGLCERGQPMFTRFFHGPSFGGAHALLATYLLALWHSGDVGVGARGSRQLLPAIWQLWKHAVPLLLHWADGLLNFKELQAAYSPPMETGKRSVWEFAELFPALSFATSRSLLRAWSAAGGYLLLGFAWSYAYDRERWNGQFTLDFGNFMKGSGSGNTTIDEVVRLASTVFAYSVFTHRLFGIPEAPGGNSRQKTS